ncbi:MAG TPA: hypothetical protein ENJ90_06805 [Devosia sp.]|nr:hypothetical protein [Devosia sp.]
MFLLRSVFWLAVAYAALVPQLEISRSVAEASGQAFVASRQIVSERVNAAQCSTLDCMGAKLVITAGLNSLSAVPYQADNVLHDVSATPQTAAPIPLPRLVRPD